ncbi:hypothetical protein BH11ACT7_BH11ACT7_33780 [soil metagenome]
MHLANTSISSLRPKSLEIAVRAANYVGRVGGLAVALGVGAATLGAASPAIASPSETASSPTAAAESASSESGTATPAEPAEADPGDTTTDTAAPQSEAEGDEVESDEQPVDAGEEPAELEEAEAVAPEAVEPSAVEPVPVAEPTEEVPAETPSAPAESTVEPSTTAQPSEAPDSWNARESDDGESSDATTSVSEEAATTADIPVAEAISVTADTSATADTSVAAAETASSARAAAVEVSEATAATPLSDPVAAVRTAFTQLVSGLLSAFGLNSTPAESPSAPLQNSVLFAVLAWVRREIGSALGQGPAQPAATISAVEPLTAATTAVTAKAAAGTTTVITWAWGTNPVIAFNPATDKLDFGWMQPTQFVVTEKNGSTQISVVDNNHTYTLTGVPVSLLQMSNIVAKDSATVAKWTTLINNATATKPSVSVADASRSEGNSGSSLLGFTVSLSKASSTAVTVKYATASGSATAGQDFTAASGTVTFAPGVTSQVVSVAVVGDAVVESTETFTVTLSSPSGATIADGSAVGTIVNDDVATLPGAEALWGQAFYAPYVDMAGWPVPDLVALSQTTGASLFTLGFIQADPNGKAAWAGLTALGIDASNEQAEAINSSIAELKAAGGDVMISFGGAAGTSLAQAYSAKGWSAQALSEAYVSVIDAYDVTHIDFDVEGAAVADPASIALNSQALRLVQQARPDVEIWFTLPVLPTGLTADGIKVVESALKSGVTVSGVNIMAMDYGESAAPTSGPNAKTMGAYAIAAANSTYGQMSKLYTANGQTFDWSQLGVTPMLGVNDVPGEVFTVADAQALENFAREKGIGMLSMWSVTRDTPGTLGQASPVASGLNVAAGSFSAVFNDYGTQNVVDHTSTSGGGGGDGGTLAGGGTTTTVSWKWGTATVLDFDPTKDKLDFVWMQPGNFEVVETGDSITITINGNNQTYTLKGVTLSELKIANIVANDPATVARWKTLISNAAKS